MFAPWATRWDFHPYSFSIGQVPNSCYYLLGTLTHDTNFGRSGARNPHPKEHLSHSGAPGEHSCVPPTPHLSPWRGHMNSLAGKFVSLRGAKGADRVDAVNGVGGLERTIVWFRASGLRIVPDELGMGRTTRNGLQCSLASPGPILSVEHCSPGDPTSTHGEPPAAASFCGCWGCVHAPRGHM